MRRFTAEGFVLVGSVALREGPVGEFNPRRARMRTASPSMPSAAPPRSPAQEAAPAGSSNDELRVRSLRYTVDDGMLYAEAQARPAVDAAVRRALRAAKGDAAEGGWGPMAATDGSEDGVAAAAALAAAAAATGEGLSGAILLDGSNASGDGALAASQQRRHRRSLAEQPRPHQAHGARAEEGQGAQADALLRGSHGRQLQSDTRWRVRDGGAFPFSAVAYITYVQPLTGSKYQCTATFITPWDVLTAAHCVWDFENATGYRDWRVSPGIAGNTLPSSATIRADYVTFYRTEAAVSNGSTPANYTEWASNSYGSQRYDVNYFDVAVIRMRRPHTAWMGLKYDCSRPTYPKTMACGYPATSPVSYWQYCSQCFLTNTMCRPLWQMYNYCYTTRGQSGMAIADLTDLRVLGVLSGGPVSASEGPIWDWSFWTPIDAFHFANLVRVIYPNGAPVAAPPPVPPAPSPPSPEPPSPEPPMWPMAVGIYSPPGMPPPSEPPSLPPSTPPPPAIPPSSPPVVYPPQATQPAMPTPLAPPSPVYGGPHDAESPPPAPSKSLNCTDGQLRLRDGPNAWSGRVELCLEGRWGTICDAGWNWDDARVACRQLGFEAGGEAMLGGWFPAGPDDMPIHRAGVTCRGDEAGVGDCPVSPPPSPVCPMDEHRFDAGVICSNPSLEAPPPMTGATNGSDWNRRGYPCAVEGAVRLMPTAISPPPSSRAPPASPPSSYAGGTLPLNIGRVEICLGGEWGSVCNDGWDDRDAQVTCRQMGYAGGYAISDVNLATGSWVDAVVKAAPYIAPGPANMSIWLQSVACSGTERSLRSCDLPLSLTPPGRNQAACSHYEDAGVVCMLDPSPLAPPQPPPPECFQDGDLRLVPLPDSPAGGGRLEVCYSGRWGLVCDDNFGAAEARVACRQLGYTYGRVAPSVDGTLPGYRGEPGTSLIWMDDVDCTAYNPLFDSWFWRLTQCIFTEWGVNDCDPTTEAVAVMCSNNVSVIIPPPPPAAPPPNPYACSPSNSIRLQAGNWTAGRVEICRNGLWSTVCDEGWGDADASVVCRQLGLGFAGGKAIGGIATDPARGFPPGAMGQPIGLSEVSCTGTEAALGSCGSRNSSFAWSRCSAAGHRKDAGVVCTSAKSPPPSKATTDPYACAIPDAVRLMTGVNVSASEAGAGRVEICHGGKWGSVCRDSWDDADATVVCRQLGYASGTAVVDDRFGSAARGLVVWLDEVSCDGGEAGLAACYARPWGMNDCRGAVRLDAGVVCSSEAAAERPQEASEAPPSSPAVADTPQPPVNPPPSDLYPCSVEGAVRVVGTTSGPNSQRTVLGRVELCWGGQWGALCGRGWQYDERSEHGMQRMWDDASAQVICRQYSTDLTPAVRPNGLLEYQALMPGDEGYTTPVSDLPYGMRFWLYSVQCDGDEATVGDCGTRSQWGAQQAAACGEGDVAGVRCVYALAKGSGR
ncbi:hypothetical protein HYH03_008770 [Edaphochlamys debaryana]|uniref:SRCR domain-containing protein n=1 Tax=Edaphochlamys debaryana TaxID=47281 RepID=A0A836BYL9_9CHLO|nr:hypothetical protein HYH03_008770 [Edaphochlamys debaryana]|eukprot:KAG2493107.1 hypothetical protein HYH03_008770 [Edaphochlamys debaryana]